MFPLAAVALTVLSQSPLGEAGESCRSSADCSPQLTCTNRVCVLNQPSIGPPPPPPLVSSSPPPLPVSAPSMVENVDESAESPSPFLGVRFAMGMGAAAGLGYGLVRVGALYEGAGGEFESVGLVGGGELKLGLFIERFEVALRTGPTAFIARGSSPAFDTQLSLGWMLQVATNERFELVVPLRAQGSVTVMGWRPAFGGGLSAGVGLRFTHFLLEATLGGNLKANSRSTFFSFPVSVTATYVF